MELNASLESGAAGCPSRADLFAFRSGELAEDVLKMVAAHVSECARCATTLREIDESDESLIAKIGGGGVERSFLDEPECAELMARARALATDQPIGSADTSLPDSLAPRSGKEELFPLPFGKYHLLHKIDAGAMGVVYKARDLTLERVVALKMLRAGNLARPRQLQRFKTESQAMARLDHPHIVPIYDDGEYQGQPFFTMKFMSGGSLAEHLPRFSADLPGAVELMIQVARAIHYLHGKRILHRDLKPQNILLDEQGVAHVSDFGLAKFLDAELELSQTGEVVGSLPYMAPEQAVGKTDGISEATDVWALGVILYELLTGQRPFGGQTRENLVRQICQTTPIPLRKLCPHLPSELEAICLNCLEKEPGQRCASAQQLAEHLATWLGGQPVRLRRPGWITRAWRTGRRHPFLTFASVLLGCAVFAVLALLPDQPEAEKRPDVLAELEQELRERRAVTLIPDTGFPRWRRWLVNPVAPLQGEDKTFSFTSLDDSLVALLLSVPEPSFRMSVEIQHLRSEPGGEVGIFFAYSNHNTPFGVRHSCYRLGFNDKRDQAKANPKAHLKGNQARLEAALGYGKPNERISWAGEAAGLNLFFVPAVKPPMPWRKVSVEVGSANVWIMWDENGAVHRPFVASTVVLAASPLGIGPNAIIPALINGRAKGMPVAQLRQHALFLHAIHPLGDPVPPGFSHTQALGVYVRNGSAAFRNAKVELLEKPGNPKPRR